MRSRPLGEKRQELLQMREREVGEWAGRSGLPAGWELVKILIGRRREWKVDRKEEGSPRG